MSQQKITDELWVEARRRYETEPGLGSGKVAQLLDVLNLWSPARPAKESGRRISACLIRCIRLLASVRLILQKCHTERDPKPYT
jgi:hypothetical protein